MDKVEAVVVGAGVVGLAVARALAVSGHDVLVLERAAAIGTETSSRNSEVIHAGLCYEPGSLKARCCVEGKRLLYEFCDEHGVAFRRCGKLIVATSAEQVAALQRIDARARDCGVLDLQWLTGEQARSLEPELTCHTALLSPSTGIVDSHGLMLALQGGLEAHDGMVALHSELESVTVCGDGLVLRVAGHDGSKTELLARVLVNAAGLWAPSLASRIEGLDSRWVPTPWFAKGNYFSFPHARAVLAFGLPVPEAAGLGVHLTLDLGGQARFGPDVEWVRPEADGTFDYRVDPARCTGFEDAVRRYWPGMPANALAPGYSGVRPKLGPEGSAAADFMVQGPRAHGVAGLVNLFGIESPGLTASLSLAGEVLAALGK